MMTVSLVCRTHATPQSTLMEKLNDLYETIKLYQDVHQRVLSTPFVKLPTKQVTILYDKFSSHYHRWIGYFSLCSDWVCLWKDMV